MGASNFTFFTEHDRFSWKMDISNSLVFLFYKKYTGKSKQSLAAHTRKCKLNPKSHLYESPQTQVIDNLELVGSA